jgi:cell division protease FtsH
MPKRARKASPSSSCVVQAPASAPRLDELVGLDHVAAHLRRVFELVKDPAPVHALGAALARGVLIVGPRGVGKSSLVQALAGEAGLPCERLVCGESGSHQRLDTVFEKAANGAPTIVLLEDVHAWARAKSRGDAPSDGFACDKLFAKLDAAPESVFVVATSGVREEGLVPTLTRVGRLDRTLAVPRLRASRRRALLRRLLPAVDDVAIQRLAHRTARMSPIELRAIVREAACRAASEGRRVISADDVEIERRGFGRSPGLREEDTPHEDLRVLALHEAGHAVVSLLIDNPTPLSHLSIRSEGDSLGRCVSVPSTSSLDLSRAAVVDLAAVRLAGREAELFAGGSLDRVTSGSRRDLENATRGLFRMVAEEGLDDELGPLSLEGLAQEARQALYPLVVTRTRAWLDVAAARARAILVAHRAAWEALTDALLAEEELDGERAEAIVRDACVTARSRETAVAAE